MFRSHVRTEINGEREMVLQVLPNAGQHELRFNPNALQNICAAYAGEFQDVGGLDGAERYQLYCLSRCRSYDSPSAEDHFLLCSQAVYLAVVNELNTRCSQAAIWLFNR